MQATAWAAKTTLAAMQLARDDTLLADGFQAALAVENHVCARRSKVIEANTCLGSIGFEAAAGRRPLSHNGLTAIEQTHKALPVKVAFGTRWCSWCWRMPPSEAGRGSGLLHVRGAAHHAGGFGHPSRWSPRKIMEVWPRLACADTDTLHSMPFEVSADIVYAAIMGADALVEPMG